MLDVVRMALLAAVSLAIHIAERGCQWPVQPSKLYKKMQGFLIGGSKTSTVNYQESAQLAARRAEARAARREAATTAWREKLVLMLGDLAPPELRSGNFSQLYERAEASDPSPLPLHTQQLVDRVFGPLPYTQAALQSDAEPADCTGAPVQLDTAWFCVVVSPFECPPEAVWTLPSSSGPPTASSVPLDMLLTAVYIALTGVAAVVVVSAFLRQYAPLARILGVLRPTDASPVLDVAFRDLQRVPAVAVVDAAQSTIPVTTNATPPGCAATTPGADLVLPAGTGIDDVVVEIEVVMVEAKATAREVEVDVAETQVEAVMVEEVVEAAVAEVEVAEVEVAEVEVAEVEVAEVEVYSEEVAEAETKALGVEVAEAAEVSAAGAVESEEAPVVVDMEVKVDTPVAASLPLSSTQDWNAVYQADQSLVFMPSELTSDTSDDPAQDWSRDATFGMSLSESISGVAVAVNTFLATPSDSPDPYLQTGIQTLQAPSTLSLAADISVSPPAEDQPSWSADSAPTNEVLPESTSNEAARAELAAMNTLDAEAALKSDNSGNGSPWYNPLPGAIKDDRRPKFCFADRSLKLALASARAQDRPIPAVTEQMITPIKALSVPVNIPSIPVEVPATPPSVSVSPPMPKSPSSLDTPAPGTISSTPPNDSAPGRVREQVALLDAPAAEVSRLQAASGSRGGHALHPRGPLVSQRLEELRLEGEANILLPKPSNTCRKVSRIPKYTTVTTPRTTGTDSFQVAKPHGQSQIKASHAGGSDNRYPVLR